MNTRRSALLALAALACVPRAAFAQPGRVYRIGYLSGVKPADISARMNLDAFRAGMRELGYVEGKSYTIEFRYAEDRYERLAYLTKELVQMKVDVIVTAGATPATHAAHQATRTIPIVMPSGGVDPVGMGFAINLARPGGNITGLTTIGVDLASKQLELLVESVPALDSVAVLINPDNANSSLFVKDIDSSARSRRIKVFPTAARNPEELEKAFAAMARQGAKAVVIAGDAVFNSAPRAIADLASKSRLPLIAPVRDYVLAGALMSYGISLPELFRRAASYVDKILKGAKPGDLPIEQPTKFELVVNRKTAEALGIAIPQSILLQADRVIE